MLCLDLYFPALRNFFLFYTTCFYLPMKILHTREKKEVKRIQTHALDFLNGHSQEAENFFCQCLQYIFQRSCGNINVITNFQLVRSTHSPCGLFYQYTREVPSLGLIFSLSGYLSWKLCRTASAFPEQAVTQTAILALAFQLEQREAPRSTTHQCRFLWLPFQGKLQPSNSWVHLNKSPTLGSRTEASHSSLSLPETVIFDYFSFPIGKFACGDEGGIFVCSGVLFLSKIGHKNIKEDVVN